MFADSESESVTLNRQFKAEGLAVITTTVKPSFGTTTHIRPTIQKGTPKFPRQSPIVALQHILISDLSLSGGRCTSTS